MRIRDRPEYGELLEGVSGEAGDIISQDKKNLIQKAGDMAEELTTGETGSVVSKELYLGKYNIRSRDEESTKLGRLV